MNGTRAGETTARWQQRTGALPGEPEEHRVHPIVVLDYRVRIAAHLLLVSMALSHFWGRPHGLWLWPALAFTGLLWPHIAYFLSRNARFAP